MKITNLVDIIMENMGLVMEALVMTDTITSMTHLEAIIMVTATMERMVITTDGINIVQNTRVSNLVNNSDIEREIKCIEFYLITTL